MELELESEFGVQCSTLVPMYQKNYSDVLNQTSSLFAFNNYIRSAKTKNDSTMIDYLDASPILQEMQSLSKYFK